MLPYLGGDALAELVELRRTYRLNANLFSAALISCRDGAPPAVFDDLMQLLEDQGEEGFSEAANKILGDELMPRLKDLVNAEGTDYPRRLRGQVARIETEIGCSIQEFVEGIADAAAFDSVVTSHMKGVIPAREEAHLVEVYPICSVIRQDTQDLVTSATATSVVRSSFEDICSVVDPANWAQAGSIIAAASFVDHPFDLREVGPRAFGTGEPALLRESARISWSQDPDQQASFENVLNVVSWQEHPDDQPETLIGQEFRRADVRYNLCRSISSTVLWDQRAGGILVDQGFIKIRPLGGERWQVTLRKEVQFSDRTPYSGGRGLRDFGQLANYLAPATLATWLECETYGNGTVGTSNQIGQSADGSAA